MFERSVITRSGQTWKMIVCAIALVIAVGSVFLGCSRINALTPEEFTGAVLGGAVFGIIAAAVACAAIRCPNCGARWVWEAVRKQAQDKWLLWLTQLSCCPHCLQSVESARCLFIM